MKGKKGFQPKISKQVVIAARRLFWDEKMRYSELSHRYQIHKSTIRQAILGITWRNLKSKYF